MIRLLALHIKAMYWRLYGRWERRGMRRQARPPEPAPTPDALAVWQRHFGEDERE